jgi:hypothetical protein
MSLWALESQDSRRQAASGKFAREFIQEMNTGQAHYRKLLRKAEKHPIEEVGARLRGLMSWKAKRKQKAISSAAALGSAPSRPNRFLPELFLSIAAR